MGLNSVFYLSDFIFSGLELYQKNFLFTVGLFLSDRNKTISTLKYKELNFVFPVIKKYV